MTEEATEKERTLEVHFSHEQSYSGKSSVLTITNKSNTGKFHNKSFEFTVENLYFVGTYYQIRLMEILLEKISSFQQKVRSKEINEVLQSIKKVYTDFLQQIRSIGTADRMNYYEKRKLGVFNQLNFFQLLTGLLIPVIGWLHADDIPFSAWLLSSLPAVISISSLVLNHQKRHHAALLCYFILYPFFTGFVYLQGMNAGIELNFILFGVLAVFFYKTWATCCLQLPFP